MIIDSHLHVPFNYTNRWEDVTAELINQMKLVGIDKTCIMPYPHFPGYIYINEKDTIYQAQTLTKMVETYPGKFLPLLFINPLLPLQFLKSVINDYILNGSIIGIKFHIQVLADDKRLRPLLSYLEAHDIPILFHTWYKTVSRGTFESDPSNIARMAEKHPRLRILMAHLMACKLRGIQDIKKFLNVFVDTSGSQPENGYLRNAIDALGADRILFGTDYPIRDFSSQLGKIDGTKMNQDEREKILYKNAMIFFKRGGQT